MIPGLYTGEHVVSHQIQRGETLSGIAPMYHFSQWQPIWVYNTQVERILGPNPDLIQAGDIILIPRNRQSYDKLIRQLQSLKSTMAGQANKLKYELEAEYYKHQGARVLFDLAGDIATMLGTLAVKAASAARAARLAEQTTGRGRVAAKYLADKASKEVRTHLTKELKSEVIKGCLERVDEHLKDTHSPAQYPVGGMDWKTTYSTGKTVVKGLKMVRDVSLQHGKSLLDIADLVISQFSVSKVADAVLLIHVGETPKQSYEHARDAIAKSVRETNLKVDAKVRKYENERRLLYGG